MAKYYGMIGFVTSVETPGSVYKDMVIERPFIIEVIKDYRKFQSSTEKTHDDVTISNKLSIISDTFAIDNLHNMKYATYLNAKWKIEDIEVQTPRLLLTLGGLYNG